MKKLKNLAVPADIRVKTIIFLSGGEEVIKGSGLIIPSSTPLFVWKVEALRDDPQHELEVLASIGEVNGELRPFRFESLDHHQPKKKVPGQIFLTEEEAIANMQLTAEENLKKAKDLHDKFKKFDIFVKGDLVKYGIAPVGEEKSRTLNVDVEKGKSSNKKIEEIATEAVVAKIQVEPSSEENDE